MILLNAYTKQKLFEELELGIYIHYTHIIYIFALSA